MGLVGGVSELEIIPMRLCLPLSGHYQQPHRPQQHTLFKNTASPSEESLHSASNYTQNDIQRIIAATLGDLILDPQTYPL
jgi:hypothetical protein